MSLRKLCTSNFATFEYERIKIFLVILEMAINSKLIRGTEHFVIATYCFNSVVIKVCGNVYLSRFSLFFKAKRPNLAQSHDLISALVF